MRGCKNASQKKTNAIRILTNWRINSLASIFNFDYNEGGVTSPVVVLRIKSTNDKINAGKIRYLDICGKCRGENRIHVM